MSRTTLTGYNRDHCTTRALAMNTIGTHLINKDGDYLIVPAGWGITEIHLRNVSASLTGTAPKLKVYLGETGAPDINILEVMNLDLVPSASLVGTDGSLIRNALTVNKYVMLKTDTGTLDGTVCVVVKTRRD